MMRASFARHRGLWFGAWLSVCAAIGSCAGAIGPDLHTLARLVLRAVLP